VQGSSDYSFGWLFDAIGGVGPLLRLAALNVRFEAAAREVKGDIYDTCKPYENVNVWLDRREMCKDVPRAWIRQITHASPPLGCVFNVERRVNFQ